MESKEFIDGLKRDKARGNLAPHQVILLIAFLNLHEVSNRSKIYDISRLIEEFKKVWINHQFKFETKNNNIGLPLRALVNAGYIEIEVISPIKDYRNKQELKSKITKLVISNILDELFHNENLMEELSSRIVK
ncbi:hypothetical protein B0A67_13295 [Flavobacterium aquidurense]|uniref:hypothetical protein n=1 Tax=Flavobacterium aquidurense TaxID=362413 RepID=UPI000916470D|nr:hypothetical protein [Flavobacterium aquidurense]OXA71232.1 hypothetical protein B0A67_13295 [Flavobacterium aquidurense]SHG69174.1 hypothetical protein SAMN05444481_106209 [Flavobacterium frigidimaris]